MNTTDQSYRGWLWALKDLYGKAGLLGYRDMGGTACRPASIEPKIRRWRDIYPALRRAEDVVPLDEDTFHRANGMTIGSTTPTTGAHYADFRRHQMQPSK